MLYLRRKKTATLKTYIFLLLGLVFISFDSKAQVELYLEEHDAKPYYFGITLASNMGRFHTHLHSNLPAAGQHPGGRATQFRRVCPGSVSHCQAHQRGLKHDSIQRSILLKGLYIINSDTRIWTTVTKWRKKLNP